MNPAEAGLAWLLLAGTSLGMALFGVVAFYNAWVHWRRYLFVRDTPTSTIRAAAQGHVELKGQLADGNLQLIAPLTGLPCCWWRYRIEEQHKNDWHLIDSGSSDNLLILQDDTGRCLIDTRDMDAIPSDPASWKGFKRRPDGYSDSQRSVYRYHELRMTPGETLYALGNLLTRTTASLEPRLQQELRLLNEPGNCADRLPLDEQALAALREHLADSTPARTGSESLSSHSILHVPTESIYPGFISNMEENGVLEDLLKSIPRQLLMGCISMLFALFVYSQVP